MGIFVYVFEKSPKFSCQFWRKTRNFRAQIGPKRLENGSKMRQKNKKARLWEPNRPVLAVAGSEDRRLTHYARPTCAPIFCQKCENPSKIAKTHPKSPKTLQNRQTPSKIVVVAPKSLQNSSEITKIPPKSPKPIQNCRSRSQIAKTHPKSSKSLQNRQKSICKTPAPPKNPKETNTSCFGVSPDS